MLKKVKWYLYINVYNNRVILISDILVSTLKFPMLFNFFSRTDDFINPQIITLLRSYSQISTTNVNFTIKQIEQK